MMMQTEIKKNKGFSLIELVIFIIICGILLSSIFLYSKIIIPNKVSIKQQITAYLAAQQCIEWFLGQRYINGYASLSCPSTPVGKLCTAPSGYTVSTSITCTTINGDSNYKTITVSVTGPWNSTYSTVIANY